MLLMVASESIIFRFRIPYPALKQPPLGTGSIATPGDSNIKLNIYEHFPERKRSLHLGGSCGLPAFLACVRDHGDDWWLFTRVCARPPKVFSLAPKCVGTGKLISLRCGPALLPWGMCPSYVSALSEARSRGEVMAGRDLSSDGLSSCPPEELTLPEFRFGPLSRASYASPVLDTTNLPPEQACAPQKSRGEAMATDVIPAIERRF